MPSKFAMILGLILGTVALSGCVPVAVGAGAAVVADSVAEDQQGGDGLF